MHQIANPLNLLDVFGGTTDYQFNKNNRLGAKSDRLLVDVNDTCPTIHQSADPVNSRLGARCVPFANNFSRYFQAGQRRTDAPARGQNRGCVRLHGHVGPLDILVAGGLHVHLGEDHRTVVAERKGCRITRALDDEFSGIAVAGAVGIAGLRGRKLLMRGQISKRLTRK